VTESPMTPASIGAMLDGVPEFDFGDDLPPLPSKQPAPAPQQAVEHAPEALKQADVPPVSVPEAKSAEPAPAPTGPVFETTVIAPDGSADKPAEPAPAKKGWWRR
jgi:hypothetical protein